MAGMTMPAGAGVTASHYWTEFGDLDSSLIMPDFDLTGELSLKIELHMLRPITEKVHSGNGPVSLVTCTPIMGITCTPHGSHMHTYHVDVGFTCTPWNSQTHFYQFQNKNM